jgi:L-ascorbate metabolism protein UlaG (beta-lactamase superfamily)
MICRRASFVLMAGLLLAGTAQAQTPAPDGGKAELQWFAQSAFKFTTPGGKVIMILVSHGHGDHFGDSVELAKKNNVPVLGTAGMGQTLQVLGILPPALSVRMNKSGTIQPFDGVKITQVHADHSSEMVLKDPATAKDGSYPGGEPQEIGLRRSRAVAVQAMVDGRQLWG